MSMLRKLFGAFSSQASQEQPDRREPGLAGASKTRNGKEPVLATDWQPIRDRTQAEVRGLVSKCIVEQIYETQPGVAYEDREVLLQSAANRLYADALYKVLSAAETPPFSPSEEIMRWARDGLDESQTGSQPGSSSSGDSGYDPPIEAKQSTTDAIYAALERASKNEVLVKAARQRIQAETVILAAE